MALHEWQFGSAALGGGAAVVTGVCGSCGLSRVSRPLREGNDGYIDLRGECPGEAQEPPEKPRPMVG